MALSKELKEAILSMPSSEKDKLLLRLIGKHNDLQQQLEFQLLEFGETMELRRRAVMKSIDKMYQYDEGTAGWLLMAIRTENAEITTHVKITKDKYGEIELTLYLLNQLFEKWLVYIEKYSSKNDTLAQYVAKRTEFIVKKLEKLHPDLQFDFVRDVNRLLERVHQYASQYYARELKLPKEWVIK
ncbi:MAG: hypothetical protein U0Y10_14110 [Spirosomataceae bacterium]